MPQDKPYEPKSDLKIELRTLRYEDYIHLKESMIQAYPGLEDNYWDRPSIKKLLEIFPDGQICVTANGKVVGAALTIIVNYKKFGDNHTFNEITADDSFKTHADDGDTLYGIEIFVHPEYRNMRIGRRLYDARKELCESLNLRAIVIGGRIPNFYEHSGNLSPRQYINKVKLKEIYDPTLTFQLANDFHPKKILRNYLPDDKESKEYGVLMQWNNIYFDKDEKLISESKTNVRIGLVQWQMRLFRDMDALMQQAEFFVDSVSGYKSDFILFPEFFNAPMMAELNHLGEAAAIREMSQHTFEIRDRFLELAVGYNVNIIAGSMPIVEDGNLKNVSYLCRRDGTWEDYYKIHITPAEINAWGMVGGDKIHVMDTDCGKIGILICYDVEFPELARLYAEQGMQILFVPYMTDTQNGYNRVRLCAQARAIENECYVVIAGSVGNLPRVQNMDIQYSQSAILTPSDFQFPTNAIKAEATPNTEMTVIADIDLEMLKELHEHGSVRTLKDRRLDLYNLTTRKR